MIEQAEMLSVSDAISRVAGGFKLIGSEHISLTNAHGRVLAENLEARLTQPPVAMSSMDGYAVRAEDVVSAPMQLKILGESKAGSGFNGMLGPGECVRIFTGAPVPEGANAVVMQEMTSRHGGRVEVKGGVAKGTDIRIAGLDFCAGDVLLRTGRVLTARDIGLAAAMNIPWLQVRRRPRIALIATGDEIVMPGDPLGVDQIISSNSVSLSALISVLGGIPINVGISRDTEEALRDILARVDGVDALVTVGGASVGEYDLIRRVMGAEGLILNFYKVAMRPGKPLIFGKWNEIPLLGLPGNPVSAGVTAAIFLRAAMEIMLGTGDGSMVTERVRLGQNLPPNGKREDFMRAKLDCDNSGELRAIPFARQDSSMMAIFTQADCLLIRAPNAPAAKEGDFVPIWRLNFGTQQF